MVTQQEDVFYYVTVMNENYEHPAMPPGAEQAILKGMYLFREGSKKKQRVQLLGSGTILREVIAAGELLQADWDVAADIWSAPSLTELRREGLAVDRWNMLHPEAKARVPYVTQCLEKRGGPGDRLAPVATPEAHKAWEPQERFSYPTSATSRTSTSSKSWSSQAMPYSRSSRSSAWNRTRRRWKFHRRPPVW